MKRLLFSLIPLVLLLFSQTSFAQQESAVPQFHRLLIFNAENELLVVKIKNTDFWVTPGLYSQSPKAPNDKLYKLAAEYGISITPPKHVGTFNLQNNQSKKNSIRHFYKVKSKLDESLLPDNIEQVTWLPLEEAVQLISFPHINKLTLQVINHPQHIWGGTILRYQENKQFKAEMTKDFFVLKDNKDQ